MVLTNNLTEKEIIRDTADAMRLVSAITKVANNSKDLSTALNMQHLLDTTCSFVGYSTYNNMQLFLIYKGLYIFYRYMM